MYLINSTTKLNLVAKIIKQKMMKKKKILELMEIFIGNPKKKPQIWVGVLS